MDWIAWRLDTQACASLDKDAHTCVHPLVCPDLSLLFVSLPLMHVWPSLIYVATCLMYSLVVRHKGKGARVLVHVGLVLLTLE